MAEPTVRLEQINLVSRDVLAAVEFYRLLGVPIPDVGPEWQAWEQEHRNAERGEESVLDFDLDSRRFADYWGAPEMPDGPMLGFRVSSREGVDLIYERLTRAGHRGLREPYDAFWGARIAVVLDPDGVAVGLMSEVDEEHRSRPPDLDHM